HLLSQVPYKPLTPRDVTLPKRQRPGGYQEPACRCGTSRHRSNRLSKQGNQPKRERWEPMRAAGIRRYSAPVEPLDLPGPGELRPDEVLLEVRCCGVGNWDEFARAGAWDGGRRPPMALGVEVAGVVAGAGGAVTGFAAGDRVMTHSLPLRAQGGWAEWFVAAAADVAAVPAAVPLEVAAALPVPALTADQALRAALGAGPGATVLVHGAG